MKIKRLTFTKISLKLGCILVPLLIMYHWVPKESRIDAPFFYMALTLIIYELGKFVGNVLTDDKNY